GKGRRKDRPCDPAHRAARIRQGVRGTGRAVRVPRTGVRAAASGGASRSAGAALGRSRLVPFGRQYAAARIGGGGDGAAVGPGAQVVHRIDDAPAELAIGGTGSVGAVLFEGAGRKAQEFSRFLGAKIARREYGEIGSHGSGLRGVR